MGPASRVACPPPNRQSGKYSSHWDEAIGGRPTDDVFRDVTVPTFHRFDATLCEVELPTIPVHAALVDEWRSQDLRPALSESIASGSLGRVYAEHPVVQSARPDECVWPYAIYVDGFSYRRHDGIIAYYVHPLPTNTRHLRAAVRASELCSCGCRG